MKWTDRPNYGVKISIFLKIKYVNVFSLMMDLQPFRKFSVTFLMMKKKGYSFIKKIDKFVPIPFVSNFQKRLNVPLNGQISESSIQIDKTEASVSIFCKMAPRKSRNFKPLCKHRLDTIIIMAHTHLRRNTIIIK